MSLLERFLKSQTKEMLKSNVRLQAIGRLTDLPDRCQKALHESIEATAHNDGLTLILALNYGGREEIIDGIRSVLHHVQDGLLDIAMLDPQVFSKHLYTRYYPDPDLLIRTSGEMRISNFLLWQISYAEIVISDKFWPDFTRKEFFKAIEEYSASAAFSGPSSRIAFESRKTQTALLCVIPLQEQHASGPCYFSSAAHPQKARPSSTVSRSATWGTLRSQWHRLLITISCSIINANLARAPKSPLR